MKRLLLVATMMAFGLGMSFAQSSSDKKQAKIEFEETSFDFGTFSESTPKQTHTFTYTNVGNAPLIINQAVASCGCTVPEYTKTPVMPGEKGQLKVTYNGMGRFPGHFKKTITVRTNGEVEMTRLYIQGNMEESKKK